AAFPSRFPDFGPCKLTICLRSRLPESAGYGKISAVAAAGVILSEISDMLGKAAKLHRQNQVPEAMAAYGEILTRWPKAADAWYNLAVLQRQTFRFDEALSSYQR